MSETLDRRLNAFRPDLADAALREKVAAERYVAGEAARIRVPVADVKTRPDRTAGTDTQLMMGEAVTVFDRTGGWCWVQALNDGYVGYVEESTCSTKGGDPSHRVVVPRTFLYPGPDLRFPPVEALSAGSLLAIADEAETRGTLYYVLADGSAVISRHCLPTGETATMDYVAIAESFMETPYLWGGRSGFGIDCSGLVQLSLQLTGRSALRDSDMQEAGLGDLLATDAAPVPLRRGDFVFWKGHVGMMQDPTMLLHASGYTMSVTSEPLDEAVDRIATQHGLPTAYRRLPA